jgi:hypothetical protein
MTAAQARASSHSATDRAWAATRKGLVELRRGTGRRWRVERTHFMGEPVSMLLPPGPGRPMLAALNLGHFGVKLHASSDEGSTWREVACPAYPEQPADATGVPWKLVQVWELAESASETGVGGPVLWAGTLPGGLFRSADGGASWQLVQSLWNDPSRGEWFGGGYDVPGIHSVCPHPERPGELLVGISCGGARLSTDGGATWAARSKGMRADFMPPEQAENPNTQDPHRIQRCAAEPDVLWCQHHCGIWRSHDNAETWQQLEAAPSSFGFAVAAHPQRGDTAWFAPGVADQKRVPVEMTLCVTRTRDGGRSFEALREGLPQQDCYDLIYRHGLDVAADGESLVMGSTTGHLWASADGGDSWQAAALNLPPIYAVRFG